MELSFDIRGNLKPYEIVEVSYDDFHKVFVEAFDEESTRAKLFNYYEKYVNDLSDILERNFYQWIDGSYISNRVSPRDIDLLTIVDYRDYDVNKSILEKKFASFEGRKNYNVDAYIISSYPDSHKRNIFTKSDLAYWRSLFSKTRANRAKKQFTKGFIQINFSKI